MSLFLEMLGALFEFIDFSEFLIAVIRVLWPVLIAALLYGVCANVWFVHGPFVAAFNCSINIAGAILGAVFMLAIVGYYAAKS